MKGKSKYVNKQQRKFAKPGGKRRKIIVSLSQHFTSSHTFKKHINEKIKSSLNGNIKLNIGQETKANRTCFTFYTIGSVIYKFFDLFNRQSFLITVKKVSNRLIIEREVALSVK